MSPGTEFKSSVLTENNTTNIHQLMRKTAATIAGHNTTATINATIPPEFKPDQITKPKANSAKPDSNYNLSSAKTNRPEILTKTKAPNCSYAQLAKVNFKTATVKESGKSSRKNVAVINDKHLCKSVCAQTLSKQKNITFGRNRRHETCTGFNAPVRNNPKPRIPARSNNSPEVSSERELVVKSSCNNGNRPVALNGNKLNAARNSLRSDIIDESENANSSGRDILNRSNICAEFYCSGLDCAKQILQNRSHRLRTARESSIFNIDSEDINKNLTTQTETEKRPPPLPPKIPLKPLTADVSVASHCTGNSVNIYGNQTENIQVGDREQKQLKSEFGKCGQSVPKVLSGSSSNSKALKVDLENSGGDIETEAQLNKLRKEAARSNALYGCSLNEFCTASNSTNNSTYRGKRAIIDLEEKKRKQSTDSEEINSTVLHNSVPRIFNLNLDKHLLTKRHKDLQTSLSDSKMSFYRKGNSNSEHYVKAPKLADAVSKSRLISSNNEGEQSASAGIYESLDHPEGSGDVGVDLNNSSTSAEPLSISLSSSSHQDATTSSCQTGTGGSDSGVSSNVSPPISTATNSKDESSISSEYEEKKIGCGMEAIKNVHNDRNALSNRVTNTPQRGLQETNAINYLGRRQEQGAGGNGGGVDTETGRVNRGGDGAVETIGLTTRRQIANEEELLELSNLPGSSSSTIATNTSTSNTNNSGVVCTIANSSATEQSAKAAPVVEQNYGGANRESNGRNTASVTSSSIQCTSSAASDFSRVIGGCNYSGNGLIQKQGGGQGLLKAISSDQHKLPLLPPTHHQSPPAVPQPPPSLSLKENSHNWTGTSIYPYCSSSYFNSQISHPLQQRVPASSFNPFLSNSNITRPDDTTANDYSVSSENFSTQSEPPNFQPSDQNQQTGPSTTSAFKFNPPLYQSLLQAIPPVYPQNIQSKDSVGHFTSEFYYSAIVTTQNSKLPSDNPAIIAPQSDFEPIGFHNWESSRKTLLDCRNSSPKNVATNGPALSDSRIFDGRVVPIPTSLPLQVQTLAHSSTFLPISPPLSRPLNRKIDLSCYDVASTSSVALDNFTVPYLSNNEHYSSNSRGSSYQQHNSNENSVIDSTSSDFGSARIDAATVTNDVSYHTALPLSVITGSITPSFHDQATQTLPASHETYQQTEPYNANLTLTQFPRFHTLQRHIVPTYDFIDDPDEVPGTQILNPIPGLVYEITTTVKTRVPYDQYRGTVRNREQRSNRRDDGSHHRESNLQPRHSDVGKRQPKSKKPRRSNTMIKKVPSDEYCPLVSSEDFRSSLDTVTSSLKYASNRGRVPCQFLPDGRSASTEKLEKVSDKSCYEEPFSDRLSSRFRTTSYQNAMNHSRNNLLFDNYEYDSYFGTHIPSLNSQFRSQQFHFDDRYDSRDPRTSGFLQTRKSNERIHREKAKSFDHIRSPPIAAPDNFGTQPKCAPLTTSKTDRNRFLDPETGSKPMGVRPQNPVNARPKSMIGYLSAEGAQNDYGHNTYAPQNDDDNFLSNLIRTFTGLCSKKQNRRSNLTGTNASRSQYQCGMTFPELYLNSAPPSSAVMASSRRWYNPEVTLPPTLPRATNSSSDQPKFLHYNNGHFSVSSFPRRFSTNPSKFDNNKLTAREFGCSNNHVQQLYHAHNPSNLHTCSSQWCNRHEPMSLEEKASIYLPNYMNEKEERRRRLKIQNQQQQHYQSQQQQHNRNAYHSYQDQHHLTQHNQCHQQHIFKEPQIDPVTKYLRAARNGRQEEMVALLQQFAHHGVHVEVCNSSGLNALHLAAKEGHLHIAQLLIDAGIDIHAMTKKGNTALHIAALSGHLPLVQLLVSRGANVNSVTPERGFTPLYMAAQENHLAVVKHLVDHGADVNLLTDDGFSPLAVAVQQRHADIVSFLLRLDSSATGPATSAAATTTNNTGTLNTIGRDSNTYNTLNSTMNSRRQRSTSSNRKSHLPDLHIAVKKDDSKATALLLQQASADPNVKAPGSGFTALHLAAHYGYVSIAQILLTHGANVNVPAGKDNISALHVAAKCGQTEMTRLLLGHGSEPNAKTKDGLTSLHLASRNGHEEVVDCLLLHGGGGFVDCRMKTKSGLTALHLAAQANVPDGQDCSQGHIACARLLLFHGIHVDEISRDLLTPLHISAHCGHVAMAKYLLQHYANPDARALNGFAPLHVAVRKRRIPVIILLLEYYADVNISTESGLTPLHVAAFVGADEAMHLLLKSGAAVNAESALGERPLHLAVRANNMKLAELLLSCGGEVDARTGDGGQTSLHLAARANSAPMCELLLKHGANPSNFATSAGGHSVLHAAARDGAFDCAQMLLQCGVDPNCRTMKGGELTPLHLAAKHGHLELCRLLLAHGASPDTAATSANCFTPLHMAVMNGHSDVATLLLQSGASANSIAANGLAALHMAVRRNSIEMCQRLVDQGAHVDAQTKWGESAAHTAARLGFLEMLKFLYQYCDANLFITSPLGVTPLHLAAQEDRTVVCRFLIEECRPNRGGMMPPGVGSMAEMRTKSGYTALHIAVYHNCVSTVLYLLQCGRCNPNWQTHMSGYSPLHVAAQQGNTTLAQYLLRANCQPDLRTNSGATALAIASKLRYVTLVELLKGVTTSSVTLTHDIEQEIRSFRTPESIQDATQWGENSVGGQTNIAEQEDEIDYPETEDMNCFLAPADVQFLTKEADTLPHLSASTRSLPRSGTQTPTHFESYASFNKYLSPTSRDAYGSRPPSGTSNISGYTTTSYGDNLLLSPVNAGSLMARLSISDLAHVRTFEQQVPSDNVENIPNKLSAAGFLISFVADAKGCRMRAARGNRLCFIIPARSCEQPQRITCRHVRRHKLIAPPPLAEDQALAARVLELGPVGSKFTGGPIIVEVPYVASLSNGEREIAVYTFSPKLGVGDWQEHKQPEIEPRIKMLLDSHLEDTKSPNSRRSSATFGESLKGDDSNSDQRLERVILTEIPQYIALVSRLKKDKADITPLGGILSSSVEARVQLSFPEKAVKKEVKISLHVLRIRSDIISRLMTHPQGLVTTNNLFYCSPVVTIEPRKRQFHERFTICIPSPIPGLEHNSGSLPRRPSFGAQSGGIRLLRSVTDSIHPAVWEDITDQTKLGELQNGCVTFSSKVSARFWLVHSPKPRSTPELLKIAHAVYNEGIKIPYMAKFVVFAKRHADNEARLRLFCVTDDKHENVMAGTTLESQENFTQIAKSRDVEIFDGNRNYLDWDTNSNLFPVQHPLNSFRATPMMSAGPRSTLGGSDSAREDESAPYNGNQDQQLSLTFWAFKENRIHFFVQVKDTMQNSSASGRLQIYSSGRSHLKALRSESELLQQHICTLNLNLPSIHSPTLENGSEPGKEINHVVNFASAGERRRDPTGRLCEPNLSPDSSAERALLRLTVVADNIGGDWQRLGLELGVDPNNINIIDLQVGSGSAQGINSNGGESTADSQKAYRMLHHWAEFQGVNATGAALEKALNALGRGEINPMWKKPVFRVPNPSGKAIDNQGDSARREPDQALQPEDGQVVRKLTRIIRVDPDGSRHEYLHEVDPKEGDGSGNTEQLIERAIADSPFSGSSDGANRGSSRDNVGVETRNRVIDKEVLKKTMLVDGREQVVIEPCGNSSAPVDYRHSSPHQIQQSYSGVQHVHPGQYPTYANGSSASHDNAAHSPQGFSRGGGIHKQSTLSSSADSERTSNSVYSPEEEAELQNVLDSYIHSHPQQP